MSFDPTTVAVLEHYESHSPPIEDAWYGPWNTILTTLFPAAQGYIVVPQHRVRSDTPPHTPEFALEVQKLTSPAPLSTRTILILKVLNSQYWPFGNSLLSQQISRQTDAAFEGTAHTKLYWIGAIGSRWRCGLVERSGEKADLPLVGWSDTTHDAASYASLQKLAVFVRAL